MAKFSDFIRDVADGNAFLSGTGEIRDAAGTLVAVTTPNPTTGEHTWTANGSPGRIVWSVAQAGQTRRVDGIAAVQAAGELYLAELVNILELFGSGTITGLAISAPGGMVSRVGPGTLLNLGRPHVVYANEDKTHAASNPTNPRIDMVVSRLTRTGTLQGKLEFAVLQGTPAASPVAPTPTQNSSVWEVEAYRVTVPAAASSITGANISTSQRPIATGPIADASITLQKLAANSVDSSKIVDGGVALVDLAAEVEAAFRGAPGLISTYWVSAWQVIGGLVDAPFGFNDGFAVAQNTLYGSLIHIPRATTLTGIGIARTAGTSGSLTLRFGLYRAGSNGLPNALHHDAGTLVTATTGVKSKTGLSVALPAGWYWATVCAGSFSGTMEMQTIHIFSSDPGRERPVLGVPSIPFSDQPDPLWSTQGAFSGTGALPSTFPSPGLSEAGPLVWLQTAGS